MYPNGNVIEEIKLDWNETNYQITNLTSGATYVVMVIAYINNVSSKPAIVSANTSMI